MSENTSDKNVAQEQLGEMEVQDEQPTTHDQLVVQNEFQQIGDDLDDQVPHSSSKFSPPAKRLKREMEDKNESMTSESTRFERACMGGIGSPLFKVAESFHLVNRAMIDGETANVRLCSFCPIDLHSMFVVFDSIIDARSFPVGIGTINWNDSSITFGELTVVQTDTEYVYDVRIMPKCYPPNLIDGLVLMFVFHDKRTHFHVKMHAQGQLQTTRLDSLSDKILCGVHGESAYTIDIIFSENGESKKEVEFVEYSIENGEATRFPTINWEILRREGDFYCIGNKIMVNDYDHDENQCHICSLDLNTLQWNIEIEMNDLWGTSTDGKRVLIVITRGNYHTKKTHRFVFNEPDSLGTLAWLRLKRIFDKRPEAYDVIIRELPDTFKQKCLF